MSNNSQPSSRLVSKTFYLITIGALVIGSLTTVYVAPATADQSSPAATTTPPAILPTAQALTKLGAAISYNKAGRANFISMTGPNSYVPRTLFAAGATDRVGAARGFLASYGSLFGLRDAAQGLLEKSDKVTDPKNGRSFVKFQQLFQNVPVMGGELNVQLDSGNNVVSANGEVSPDVTLSTAPAIDAGSASQQALAGTAKWYKVAPTSLTASQPALWIYDPSLVGANNGPVQLVWRVEVTPKTVAPIDEIVLVNAQTGGIVLHFSQVDNFLPNSPASAPVTAPAKTGNTFYVVASGGSDSNDCASPATACATINGAIGKAASGDIVEVGVGTYTGTGTEVVLINNSITLSGGWDTSFTTQSGMSTIDGQATRRVVRIVAGVNAALVRFIIQNGQYFGSGAGIANGISNLTVTDSTIQNNWSTAGGDQGIDSQGSLVLNNSLVQNNGDQTGVGLSNEGMATLNNTTVAGELGIGIQSFGSALTLNQSSVIGNGGGGSFLAGGIYALDGSVTLNNSTISGNTKVVADGVSYAQGGGLYVGMGPLILNNSTIANNMSINSGGGFYAESSVSVTLSNSIVARNSASSSPDCFGNVTSSGYNIIGDTTDCNVTAIIGDQFGTASSQLVNPRLGVLQDNGGPTYTQGLLAGSPALDTGNPAAPGSGGNACLATDQRGTVRSVTLKGVAF